MDYKDKLKFIEDNAGKCIVFPDLQEALIGYVELSDGTFRAAYDKQAIISKKISEINLDDLEEDDDPHLIVLDDYYFNTLGLGLSEGTPVFLEGFWDQEFSDIIFRDDEMEVLDQLIEDDNWKIFECDAESFEFDYLLILDGDKMKAQDISTEGFPDSFAFLYRFKIEENISASA